MQRYCISACGCSTDKRTKQQYKCTVHHKSKIAEGYTRALVSAVVDQ